ncbi:hypothetical protein OIDMADRAFT_111132 [Oidiodendron maius Zn]|uniref:HTH APSES-type domain-containing protein n=1 Tax=Oidiodendron maius (strain Zn) TaxID=913774 RepID=A0A0C3HWP8_OIDMZ|nr:hypothetical protein OIDMADRAFT_111132 [Oidiodendron maius Zn]
MRPRLTTSIFEEEGSLCFQVDVNGICVARREDNHMINGTKLLNVAQMTRGRRDGILKAEKQKAVVKIGPMHLKGVWIPFERALALANQEQITERLYPLFVHQIDSLLYHPANAARPVPLPGAYPEEQRMSPLQVQSPLQAHAQPHMSPPAQAQPPHGNAQTQQADDDRRPRL